jgi:MFS family permease
MKTAPSTLIVLIATLSVQALVSMCLLTLPVVGPEVAKDIGLTPAYLGVYIATAYIAAMTASLMSGGAVKRFGAIRCSQAGLLFCAVGLGLSAMTSVWAVALGAVFIGFGYGPITPASSHLLAISTPPERMSFVFSLKQTGVPLGGALAGVVVPGLSHLISWQLAFLLVALVSLLCAIAIQPLCANLDADRDPARKIAFINSLSGPLKLVFRQRSLTVLAGVSFLFSISQLSLTTYMVTFLYEDLGFSLVTAGAMLAAAQAAGVGGRLVWGYLADRYLGSIRMLAVLAAIIIGAAVVTPFLGSVGSDALIWVILATFGASAIGWNGVYLAEVARQAPKGQAGLATAGTLSMTFLGVVVGPPLFGVIASTFHSYGIAYAALIVPALVCLVLLMRNRHAFATNNDHHADA